MTRSAGAALRIASELAHLPDRIRAQAQLPLVLPRGLRGARRLQVTGVGSSAGHARFLVEELQQAGLPASFTPLSRFASGLPDVPEEQGLILFSQGLSPNARLALTDAGRWRGCVLVGAAATRTASARSFLDERGVAQVDTGADEERGALVRLVGPVLAYLAALRIVSALRGDDDPVAAQAPAIADAISTTHAAATRAFADAPDEAFEGPFWLFSSGRDPASLDNLRLKLSEGLLRPAAPVEDLLSFGHGPFQNLVERAGTIFLPSDPGDTAGDALRDRLRSMLGERHHSFPLEACGPSETAILEHETALGCFVVEAWRRQRSEPSQWPGQGRDGALYDLDAPLAEVAHSPSAPATELASLCWPDLEARLATGATTAVIGLGSTEQHGPHMPFATDTWIAEALIAGLCRRLPDAIGLPALPFGCASEHMAFPGTLDLRAETLGAILEDLLRSLQSHGFERAFVFSAHGGNVDLLREQLPGLAERLAPLDVRGFTAHAELQTAWSAIAAEAGISPEQAGHHAGEVEASLLWGLAPNAGRSDRAEAGFVGSAPDPSALFYPDLRANSPSGTVGDPTLASAGRAPAYLEAWLDALEAACEPDPKKRRCTKGTKNA